MIIETAIGVAGGLMLYQGAVWAWPRLKDWRAGRKLRRAQRRAEKEQWRADIASECESNNSPEHQWAKAQGAVIAMILLFLALTFARSLGVH
jgi:hypothetical protein